MFYESELKFLCDTLKNSHVRVAFSAPSEVIDNSVERIERIIMNSDENPRAPLTYEELLGNIDSSTVYKVSNSFKLCYIVMLLPAMEETTLFIMGPYLTSALTDAQIFEICEEYNVSGEKHKTLKNYYSALPVIPETSHLFVMFDTFCEIIYGDSTAFTVVDISLEFSADDFDFSAKSGDDELAKMEILEKRYAFENELMLAVTRGQLYKAPRILESFSAFNFEKRLADTLRNTKNYCIILNTLLRKAAENGGVHPLYIDKTSSAIAGKIERLSSVKDSGELINDMFRTYCKLVRKHSIRPYSQAVQKAIVAIDSDLSANLSLSYLAEMQNISSGYLSTVFKKETGVTVTEYIAQERIQLAKRLLQNTNLQVQTIAMHCGIMDVQYFSKLFKKHVGMTPKEYKKEAKNSR